MMAVTAPDCVVIGNVMLMLKIAAACGAQRQEHLGPKRFQVILAMQLAEESIR
jgi:hypothetical protein